MKAGIKKLSQHIDVEVEVIGLSALIVIILICALTFLFTYTNPNIKHVQEVDTVTENHALFLEVENKYEVSYSRFFPFYVLELSNGHKLTVTYKEYNNYEIGQSYNFILVNEVKSTTYIKQQ